jgi:hypothetical protein
MYLYNGPHLAYYNTRVEVVSFSGDFADVKLLTGQVFPHVRKTHLKEINEKEKNNTESRQAAASS